MAEQTRQFTLSTLSDQEKAYLRSLPLQCEVERDGRHFHLCHAVPSDPLYGYCLEDSDRWAAELQELPADILLVGHTHMPFIRRLGNRTVANPGSLGQPKTGRSGACYAVWNDSRLELKEFSYPVEAAIAKLQGLPVTPDVRKDLAAVLRRGSPESP